MIISIKKYQYRHMLICVLIDITSWHTGKHKDRPIKADQGRSASCITMWHSERICKKVKKAFKLLSPQSHPNELRFQRCRQARCIGSLLWASSRKRPKPCAVQDHRILMDLGTCWDFQVSNQVLKQLCRMSRDWCALVCHVFIWLS